MYKPTKKTYIMKTQITSIRLLIGRMTIERFALLRQYARERTFIGDTYKQHAQLVANQNGARIITTRSFIN